MHGLVRVLVFSSVIVILYLLKTLFRVNFSSQMQYCTFCVVLVSLLSLTLLPFENIFCTFDSPDEVYRYMSFSNTKLEIVVEGDECDYAIGKTTKEKEFARMIIPKTDRGYKIGMGLKTKMRNVSYGNPSGCTVSTIEYGDDMFVEISFLSSGPHEVTSNEKADFTVRKLPLSDGEELFEYYIHVSDKESFKLYVEGTEIEVLGKQ